MDVVIDKASKKTNKAKNCAGKAKGFYEFFKFRHDFLLVRCSYD